MWHQRPPVVVGEHCADRAAPVRELAVIVFKDGHNVGVTQIILNARSKFLGRSAEAIPARSGPKPPDVIIGRSPDVRLAVAEEAVASVFDDTHTYILAIR